MADIELSPRAARHLARLLVKAADTASTELRYIGVLNDQRTRFRDALYATGLTDTPLDYGSFLTLRQYDRLLVDLARPLSETP